MSKRRRSRSAAQPSHHFQMTRQEKTSEGNPPATRVQAPNALPSSSASSPAARRPKRSVVSVVIGWNPKVPLPHDWPFRTNVVEVLPGEAIPWVAANGGFAILLESRWGSGSWLVEEIDATLGLTKSIIAMHQARLRNPPVKRKTVVRRLPCSSA